VDLGKFEVKKHRITDAIALAEKQTSGEIRVHLSQRIFDHDPMKSARKWFTQLDLHGTRYHNGVLLYINLRRKKFAILGDTGIHARVGQEYWNQVAVKLQEGLRSTHVENAVVEAVENIGKVLKKHFPLEDGDENPDELSNEVTDD